ncbi:MAG: glycine cleavage system protein R [Aeromonas sp.]
MAHYLLVNAMGTDRPGIVNEVTQLVRYCGCNIVDSRLGVFGNEFSFIMLLDGPWNSLLQLEASLPLQAQAQAWDLTTMIKRTQAHAPRPVVTTASAEICVRDQPGAISRYTQFFSDHGWDIQAMQTSTEAGTPFDRLHAVFLLNLLPPQLPAAAHADFAAFCARDGVVSSALTFHHK